MSISLFVNWSLEITINVVDTFLLSNHRETFKDLTKTVSFSYPVVLNRGAATHKGSISPTFYEQLFLSKIPKGQK